MPRGEHVEVHPVDPKSPHAGKMKAVAGEFLTIAHNFRTQAARGAVGEEGPGARLKIMDHAGEYAHSLHNYWSRFVNYARDNYMYSMGDRKQIDRVMQKVTQIGSDIKPQMEEWEKVTSPHADKYDPSKIIFAALNLQTTLHLAAKEFDKPGLDATPQAKAEAGFNLVVGATIAGLSEQIGKRLDALGTGHVVAPINPPEKVREAIQRTKSDKIAEQLAKELTEAERDRDIFLRDYDFTLGSLTAKLETGSDKELRLIASEVDRFKLSDQGKRQMEKARGDLEGVKKKLSDQNLSPSERSSLEADRQVFAGKLAALELPHLAKAVTAAKDHATEAKKGFDEHQQTSLEAQAAIGKELAESFFYFKDRFTVEAKALGKKNFGETLKEAFGEDLSNQLKSWDRESAKARLDQSTLENLATQIFETTYSYSQKSELLLKDLDPKFDPKLRRIVLDRLNSGLKVIRDLVAQRLESWYKNDAFE